MDINKLLSRSLKKLDENINIPDKTFEEAWSTIEVNKTKRNKRKLGFSFKEFSAVAAFALVLILIPTISSYYSKWNITGAQKSSQNTPGKNTQGQGSKPASTDTNPNQTPVNNYDPAGTIADYYPFTANVKLTYTGSGNEYASMVTYVDYINGSRIQERANNGGTEVCQVKEIKNGELRLVASSPECYYRTDLTLENIGKPEILLKEPLIKGTNWQLSDGRKCYISSTDSAITTPTGSYKALEITIENQTGKDYAYYAKGVGLIKYISKLTDGTEISSTLSKIEKNVPFAQSLKVYYDDVENNRQVFISWELKFNTNDSTKAVFENLFKNPLKKSFLAISKNTKINNLYLNTKNQTVYVDFSRNLVTDLKLGTAGELAILYNITNTLGTYYNAKNVCLTLDGKPYSSGHIVMKDGEAFPVDIKTPIELKN